MIENGLAILTEKRAEKLGEVLKVEVEWLLHGDERNKYFPADRKMMEWLKIISKNGRGFGRRKVEKLSTSGLSPP